MARAQSFSLLVVGCVLGALAVPGCPEPPPMANASAEIGPLGGALSLRGAVLVVPPGAVLGPTRFAITLLNAPPPVSAERQVTALWRFEPTDLALAVPARVTVPTTAFSPSAIARWSLPGSTTEFEDVESLDGSTGALVTDRTRLGRTYGESRGAVLRDVGPRDAPIRDAPARDTPPVDAPRFDAGPPPLAPVTVGADLRPANFSCVGVRTAPPLGAAAGPVAIEIAEYSDGGGRATFFSSRDTTGVLGMGSSSSTGAGTATARDETWTTLDFEFTSGASDGLTIPPQTAYFLSFSSTRTTRVEVFSQRSWTMIVSAASPFGDSRGLIVGSVTDCDGQAVQRARIRVFDRTAELLGGVSSFGLAYAMGTARLPSATVERTSINGAFFAAGALDLGTGMAGEMRVEVWGAPSLGEPEERLGCELVTTRDDGPVSISIGPLRADGAPACVP